jgi:ATP-dependent helicase Lhr and Lhr-like helicase
MLEVSAQSPGRAAVAGWFASRGWRPWRFQEEAWEAYAAGRGGLIQVSTGAGKTYAALMGPLAALIDEAQAGGPPAGLRIVYVTPLRALTRDIESAVRAPITEMGLAITVESRTGDTAAGVRARQRDRLPNVLVTTPESLTLLLTRADAPVLFSRCGGVIVDEWHELLPTKRGAQVELALARVRRFSPWVRAWGLSATLPNAEEAASALVGAHAVPHVIRGDMPRPVVVDSVVPGDLSRLAWAGHLGLSMLPEVVEALDPGRTTIVFTNTRSQAERWYHAILVARPQWEPVMALHHGSLDRDERERVERGLREGTTRIVVATSSLDLGVDFDPVERVFQIGSPKGIGRLVQRAGRSSHRPRTACRVTCVPTHALELIEIAAAREAVRAGEVEARSPAECPLDVLVQHLVTAALGGGFRADEMFEEVRSAWSFRGLTREQFDWSLALVTHGGRSLSAYPDHHRVVEDHGTYRVTSPRIARLHRLNVGTITADGTIEVRFVGGRSLGRIEEDFIAGISPGRKFVFAGKVLTLVRVRDLTAYVRPASGTTNYTPIWYGTKLPISESLAHSIRVTLHRAGQGRAPGPEAAAAGAVLEVQRRESVVPAPGEVLAEVTRTREGDHLFMFPFEGRHVHAGLAGVLAVRLSRRKGGTFSIAVNDYGLEVLSAEPYPFAELLDADLFTPEGLTADAIASANTNYLARLQFRDVARVAGLVVQNQPGGPRTGRQLQTSASLVFDVLSDFEPDNLLLDQARREVLERHYEHGRLGRALARLAGGALRIVVTRRPTPLSFPLVIERQAGRLSSETIADRVARMRREWESDWTTVPSESPCPAAGPAPRATARRRPTPRGSKRST